MSFLKLRNVGVFTILKRTAKQFSENDMSTYAAALAYRALFSIFPFVLFLMAMLGFLHLPKFFDWLREQAALVLPPVVLDQVNPVIDQLQSSQGGLLSMGIVLALWTASVGVRSLMNAMNKAYGVNEGRATWKLFILSVIYTIGIAGMLLVAAGLMTMGPKMMTWLAAQVGLEEFLVTLWSWLRWPAAVFLLMLAVALIYYVAPDVEQKFRFITPGSIVAVMVWLAASIGFGIYVQRFADYNATYGSIGAIIVLLLFFYITAAVLLLGAQINAVIEHASKEGKDAGEKELPEDAPS